MDDENVFDTTWNSIVSEAEIRLRIGLDIMRESIDTGRIDLIVMVLIDLIAGATTMQDILTANIFLASEEKQTLYNYLQVNPGDVLSEYEAMVAFRGGWVVDMKDSDYDV